MALTGFEQERKTSQRGNGAPVLRRRPQPRRADSQLTMPKSLLMTLVCRTEVRKLAEFRRRDCQKCTYVFLVPPLAPSSSFHMLKTDAGGCVPTSLSDLPFWVFSFLTEPLWWLTCLSLNRVHFANERRLAKGNRGSLHRTLEIEKVQSYRWPACGPQTVQLRTRVLKSVSSQPEDAMNTLHKTMATRFDSMSVMVGARPAMREHRVGSPLVYPPVMQSQLPRPRCLKRPLSMIPSYSRYRGDGMLRVDRSGGRSGESGSCPQPTVLRPVV